MSDSLTLPRRPSLGTIGTRFRVNANFFELKELPTSPIYHYDVKMHPHSTSMPRNRRVWAKLEVGQLSDKHVVYDGKQNAFSSQPLPNDDESGFVQYNVNLEGNTSTDRDIRVMMKLAAIINHDALHEFLKGRRNLDGDTQFSITALDALIRHRPAMTHVPKGKSFFISTGAQKMIGGLQVWSGGFASVRWGGVGTDGLPTGKLYVNVDVANTAFYNSIKLVDLVGQLINRPIESNSNFRRLTKNELSIISKNLNRLRIECVHRPNRPKYTICHITKTNADDTKFNMESTGKLVSVTEYFRKQYNMKLQYGSILPCIAVKQGANFLPMEVCHVVEGQLYPHKLNPSQTSEMIRKTCAKPDQRKSKINAALRLLIGDDDGNDEMKAFGVRMGRNMVSIQARVLPEPFLQYGKSSVKPSGGTWNMASKKFFNPAMLSNWVVLSFVDERNLPFEEVNHFVGQLVKEGANLGMKIATESTANTWLSIRNASAQGDIAQAISEAVKPNLRYGALPELLICIMPDKTSPIYTIVKHEADCKYGVMSQCVNRHQLRKLNQQYLVNLLLKINAKLGGQNVKLAEGNLPFIGGRPTLVLGADVWYVSLHRIYFQISLALVGRHHCNKYTSKSHTISISHPPPRSSAPSIASVVAGLDSVCTRYGVELGFQTTRQEVIAELGPMVLTHIKSYRNKTQKKPESILYFRDGVSEGQFSIIKRTELQAIREACSRLDGGNFQPKITVIVVQKRHHTRFFPIDRTTERSGNCPPGTVVDTEITHPSEFDFYVQSQASLQGTSRPTHYHVLHDDNGFDADTLEQLVYHLCFLHARCTRSVGIVPPVYYADLACYRARCHLKDAGIWSDSDVSNRADRAATLDSTEHLYDKVNERLKNWYIYNVPIFIFRFVYPSAYVVVVRRSKRYRGYQLIYRAETELNIYEASVP
ncbi:Piwi domain-containing protein [Jimgerdemannia flammicorona]|uniref:Piwi domain-containing protein n=1 Tax=Jimgerdemannia flammicorona TaxID=994334 RepID=A0A433D844_9FUNG|nr:Piwi domain-containing protein [Jimgerdemannia flammicorona]